MSKNVNENNLKTMSLGDHLAELRMRIILALLGLVAGLVICLFFGSYLMHIISQPYEFAMRQTGKEPMLLAIRPPETFLVYLKTCLLFGLIVSSPWVFYQLWAFVSAGLYPHERRYVIIIAPISAALFAAGAIFLIKIIAPMTMLFFVKFNPGIDFVSSNFTLQNYVNFILALMLVFGAAFQMPIAIIFLEKLGIVSISTLSKSRRFVILALLLIAALATPPDVISQVALAVPLYALFEGSILICRLTKKKK